MENDGRKKDECEALKYWLFIKYCNEKDTFTDHN